MLLYSGVQLTNPFYSIWATKSGRNLGVSFVCYLTLSVCLSVCVDICVCVCVSSITTRCFTEVVRDYRLLSSDDVRVGTVETHH